MTTHRSLLTPPDVSIAGDFSSDAERTYRLEPFQVPSGVSQLHLRLRYDHEISSDMFVTGGNTLDIGVFDPRGTESGSPGFRGWSGSAKSEFTIGQDWSTSPYKPDPVEHGQWNIILGAYKIAPTGLNYIVEIWFDPGLPPESTAAEVAAESPNHLATPIEPGWVRGDLHSHSLASDGDSSIRALLADAQRRGLDFLGVTDHNAAMLPDPSALPDGLPLLIPGIEVTTYKGHWNVWGADRWFDFRLQSDEAVATEMSKAKAAGGFVSLNHPRPFGPMWEYGFGLGYEAIEVWNGNWLKLNAVCLGVWDLHLTLGRRVVAVGGSDTHYLKGEKKDSIPRAELGEPTTWVKPEEPMSVESIIAELRNGRSFISASPDGPQLLLDLASTRGVQLRTKGAAGSTLMLISAGKVVGAGAISSDEWSAEFAIPSGASHIRAQIVDHVGNVEAVSNALWLE